jgi:hypothetical protein
MGIFGINNIEEFKNKSDIASKIYRDEGNRFFKHSLTFQALINYNKALNFAKSQVNVALAYGNRSAAYFSVKKYKECLENIRLAREHGFPSEKIAKLNEREQKCKLESEASSVAWNFFKLSHPANEKVPWIVDCVEMKRTEKYGRGIYAKSDLKAGDIICIEDLLINIATGDDANYKHCAICFKTAMLNHLPCLNTASVMFCSSGCRDEFNTRVEFSNREFDKVALILSKMQSAFGGAGQLEAFMRTNKVGEKSLFDFNFSDPSRSGFMRDIFTCFLSSAQSLSAASYLFNDRYGFFERQILCTILGVLDNNVTVYGHFNYAQFSEPRREHIGSGFFRLPQDYDGICYSTFYSLLNHSCMPNVKHTTVDNKAVVYVKKPVKAGEQLFVSYAGEFFERSLVERLLVLERRMVVCDCRACMSDLTLADLKYRKPKEPFESLVDSDRIETTEEAIVKIKKCFRGINQLRGVACKDYAVAESSAAQLLQKLSFQTMFPM